MHVWLNGQFVLVDDARVSAFDAGLQHGVGLFETMLARDGRVLRVHDHMRRLAQSAEELRLTSKLNVEALADAVQLTIEKNRLRDARIRLTLTGGDLNLLNHGEENGQPTKHNPTILIHAQPPTLYPDAFFDDGVTVMIADARLNPLNPFEGHKTLNYWPRLSALQAAAGVHAAEAIWFTVSNHLAGGSVSNIFLVRGGELFTPIARGEEADQGGDGQVLPSPVLPGITRQAIIDFAGDASLTVSRQMLAWDDLSTADEVFLTNSSWGVLPVVQVEQHQVGDGEVGPVTGSLRASWLSALTDTG